MTVRREADTGDDLAALAQRRVEAELVVVAVQIVDVCRDDFAFEILPRTLADAVARIDGRLAVGLLGAEVGAPGLPSRAVALRQRLAVLVGSFDAAEVGALAGPGAGDENVISGACGNGGGAPVAVAPERPKREQRRERQGGDQVFVFFIGVLPLGISMFVSRCLPLVAAFRWAGSPALAVNLPHGL